MTSPDTAVMPRGETRLEISRWIVAALKAGGVPAYGFVNGEHAEETPDAAAALHLWSDAFPVGNHTWSHANLDTVTTQQYRREIVRNEPLLERLSHGRDWAGSAIRTSPRATILPSAPRSASIWPAADIASPP